MKLTTLGAIAAANAEGIDLTADFHTLPSAKVDALLTIRKAHGYRAPANRSGSVARYFFSYLVKANNK